MKIFNIIAVMLLQMALSIAVFLIAQPIFFELLRGQDPSDFFTLFLMLLGILIATAAGVLIMIIVYRGQGDAVRDVILTAEVLTIGTFTIVSYSRLFFDGLWLAPWYQILALAIADPNSFWLAWCIIFALFCALLSAKINLKTEVLT